VVPSWKDIQIRQGSSTGWPPWCIDVSISIKHPDSEQFIDAKLERGKVTGANISVRIDDDFMKAVVATAPTSRNIPSVQKLRPLRKKFRPDPCGRNYP